VTGLSFRQPGTVGGLDHLLVRAIGWPATVLHGDPCVFDRWRWVRQNLTGGPVRTLDAGCGSGAFAMYAARRGNEAIGLSFDTRNNRVARERSEILGLSGVQFVDADLRELDRLSAGWEPFDQILCLETIEHIKDDSKLIGDLTSLLRPGGKLLLTTPSKRARPMLGDSVSIVEDGGHIRAGYTPAQLRHLLVSNGLRVVDEDVLSGLASQQLTNLMRLLNRAHTRVGWAATLPLRVTQLFDRPLTDLFRYPYFDLAAVAVRPKE
jgi:2-polyprenyl-3-methyl-5-hydroxy-6-metoxy-1,4-benzoquinol methylase